jgi:hypothetical protein
MALRRFIRPGLEGLHDGDRPGHAFSRRIAKGVADAFLADATGDFRVGQQTGAPSAGFGRDQLGLVELQLGIPLQCLRYDAIKAHGNIGRAFRRMGKIPGGNKQGQTGQNRIRFHNGHGNYRAKCPKVGSWNGRPASASEDRL